MLRKDYCQKYWWKNVIKDYMLKDSRYEKPYVGVGIPFTPISLRIFEM